MKLIENIMKSFGKRNKKNALNQVPKEKEVVEKVEEKVVPVEEVKPLKFQEEVSAKLLAPEIVPVVPEEEPEVPDNVVIPEEEQVVITEVEVEEEIEEAKPRTMDSLTAAEKRWHIRTGLMPK